MGLDMITYMRTEWVSAALCTNQTPKSADVALQLGCYDGRAVNFLPRTIDTLITSSLEPSGVLSISAERQLKQMTERRFGKEGGAMQIKMEIQRADDLKEVGDETVDVVISLQSAEKMAESGLDWQKSIREAIRVLKPNGRLLFVEKTSLGYLDYVQEFEGSMWESVGYDDIDLVLEPHVAGVAIKSEDAGLSEEERGRKQRMREKAEKADVAIAAFERGRRKRKKKKGADAEESA